MSKIFKLILFTFIIFGILNIYGKGVYADTTSIANSQNMEDVINVTVTRESIEQENTTPAIENNSSTTASNQNSTSSQNIPSTFNNSSGPIVTIDTLRSGEDIRLSTQGSSNGSGIKELLMGIAESVKNIFYIIASIYFIIISIKLIIATNTEEELENFKKGIIRITIGLIVMNLAVYFVNIIYSTDHVDSTKLTNFSLEGFAQSLMQNLIAPLIKLLETAAAFVFLLIAIFAFFRLVSANGDEEKATKGKMTIVYAILGFILIVLAGELVFAVYGNCEGTYSNFENILGAKCDRNVDLSAFVKTIVDIIKWVNSFVAVIVILMIIYSGFQIMFSGGNEEKISKAKRSILYIIIGIGILVINYFIITFFF